MKRDATPSNGPETSFSIQQHRPAPYQKVFDARKRRIRGLWLRNERFYAQLTIEDSGTGRKTVRRVPLEGAETVPQAVVKLQDLQKGRRDNTLPVLARAPKFTDYADEYFKFYEQARDAKRASTLKTERVNIGHWKKHLGEVRLHQITRAMVNKYIAQRQAAGRSGRTVNLEVIAFRNVMKRAIDDGHLKSLPTENLRPLKWTPRKRGLIQMEEIERLCAAAGEGFKNGPEFADYLRFLAFTGARRSEALRVQWADVNWPIRQVTIGADGQSKNRQARTVDFNSKLEVLLREMDGRKAPDSKWLFPSPMGGTEDRSARSFVETMRRVRAKAGLERFGFHDCRHFFISYCVMSGIDFMTIARWVGHQDGGVLIGKVYGHLSNEHAQRQAGRVVFGPAVVSEARSA
jgi:integrase